MSKHALHRINMLTIDSHAYLQLLPLAQVFEISKDGNHFYRYHIKMDDRTISVYIKIDTPVNILNHGLFALAVKNAIHRGWANIVLDYDQNRLYMRNIDQWYNRIETDLYYDRSELRFHGIEV